MADGVASKEMLLRSTGDALFALLEKEFQNEIPTLIKNVLKFFEYNCALILAKLDDASITSIEENIRNDISAAILLPGEKLDDYLGRFTKCQGNFKFLDGHRKWLALIAETCRRFVKDIDPPPASVPSAPSLNVPVPTENGASSNQTSDPKKGKPVPATVTEDNLKELEDLIFEWISSKPILSNCFESSPLTFHVVDQLELGKVVLKCPVSECNHCISLSFSRYPKYNKTKRPRRVASGIELSAPRWYIYALQLHLIKNHSNEIENHAIDDRAQGSEDTNEDQLNANDDQSRRFSVESGGDEFNGFPEENQEPSSNDKTRNGDGDENDSSTSNKIVDTRKSLKRNIPSTFTFRKRRKD